MRLVIDARRVCFRAAADFLRGDFLGKRSLGQLRACGGQCSVV